MGRPTDIHEALIAEALGDAVKVLDRIETVKPTLDKSCNDLRSTGDWLLGSLEPFQKRISAMALETQDRTLRHIAQQAKVVARNTAVEQIAGMQESARRIFKDELGQSLERVARQLREANLRERPWWEAWLTHAAAAASAASCACVLMAYLAPTGAAPGLSVANAPSPGCAEAVLPALKARDRR
jgi:hypothetical protein